MQGKNYVVLDGDVIFFKFNVHCFQEVSSCNRQTQYICGSLSTSADLHLIPAGVLG